MPDAEFEKTFADLAHATLRDHAPILLEHLVGFQLLDKSEDDSRAVGVWGFQVGDEWMYAPVFFLNGQLKGDELLYLKSRDAFVPLKENWINYLLNRRPSVLGSHEPRKPGEIGVGEPDFRRITRPPYAGFKYAGLDAAASGFRGLIEFLKEAVAEDFRPFLDVALSSPGGGKRAGLGERWHLPNFIRRAGEKAAVTLVNTMRKQAEFADAILRFYRMEDIIKAAEDAVARQNPVTYPRTDLRVEICEQGDHQGKLGTITKVDTTTVRSKEKTGDGTLIEKMREVEKVVVTLDSGGTYTTEDPGKTLIEARDDEALPPKAAAAGDKDIRGTAPRVRVMVAGRADATDLDRATLTEREKERLLRDRYVVRDRRTDDEVGTAYTREMASSFQNPTGPGYYRVLMANGRLKPHLVITAPIDVERDRTRDLSAVVVDLEGGNRLHLAAPIDIFTDLEGSLDDDWATRFAALADPGSCREKQKVVFVNEKCEGTAPFFIRRRVVNTEGQTLLYGDFDRFPGLARDRSRVLYPGHRGIVFNPSDAAGYDWAIPVDHDGICFVVTKKPGSRITRIGKNFFVPLGFKAVKIAREDIEPWKLRRRGRDESPERRPNPEELADPQTLTDFQMRLFKSAGTRLVQAVSDGIEFWLRTDGEIGSPMSKVGMIERLVTRYGLRESDALRIVKTATRTGGSQFFIRLPGHLVKSAQGYQPMGASLPEPMTATDPRLGIPTMGPQEGVVPAGLGSAVRPPELDEDAVYRARQAAQQGQKEVLDTSVVGGLIKATDPADIVDRHIGDLMLGLDRVGRILFMYYWHYEKFKERYGMRDMPELEDNLRGVFDSLGDLVLFLKEKGIEPDISESEEADLAEVL